MAQKLPTLSLRVADLLAPPYQFGIPPYPRTSSWSVREDAQLLDDVVADAGHGDDEPVRKVSRTVEIGGDLSRINAGDYAVEHILPHRPPASSGWRHVCTDSRDRERCSESVGNPVPLSQVTNEQVRYLDFADKKQILSRAAGLATITREALMTETWDAETIKSREQRPMGIVRGVLRLDPPASRGLPSASR